jgi:hypothetical protein
VSQVALVVLLLLMAQLLSLVALVVVLQDIGAITETMHLEVLDQPLVLQL